MFTSKMPLLWVLNHILLALQICTVRYLEKNQRPKTQILSSGFVILRNKGSMCLGSARFVSMQAIFISRQVPFQAAFVEMQTRELCLKRILPRQKLPSHYRPQMYVCQEELRLPSPVSNKLSRNWTTGSTSPSCTLWQLWLRPVFKKNTEFWEECNTVSLILPKPGLADPSRGLARPTLGPSWAVGQVLTSHRQPWTLSISHCPPGHPSLVDVTAQVSLSGDSTAGTQSFVKGSKSACSRHSFSFGKQRLFFLLQPPLFDPVWPVIKGKASPTKTPELYFTGSPFS